MGLGCFRHVSVAGGRPRGTLGIAREGHAKEKHRDLDFIVDQLDWEANVDPHFKENHYLEPITAAGSEKEGWVDKWVVYGKVRGEQLFSAKEVTVWPGAKVAIKDNGANSIITV